MKVVIQKLLREWLINEAASPIVYHFTSVNRLSNILSKNEMFLTPTISSSNEKKMSGNKFYFLSLSRTKSITHGYGTKFTNPNSVRIKFNGNKLNSKYKIKPIDYWQYPRTKDFMGGIGDEMEDRLMSDKSSIPNINNYIISIDIFIDESGIDGKIISLAKSLGVKLNFFDNKKDFASGNESKTINPNIKSSDNSDDYNSRLSNNDLVKTLASLSYKNEKLLQDIILKLTTEFNVGTDFSNKLYNNVKEYQDKLEYYLKPYNGMYVDDFSQSLSSELHNSKTSSNEVVRYLTNEFIKRYKSLGATSIKDFLQKLMYMGKKSQQDFNKQFNNDIIKLIDKSYVEYLDTFKTSGHDYDNYYENLFELPQIKQYLDSKINEIKKYVSNYILNNDDMYHYSYVLNDREISDAINLKDDNKLKQILNKFEDVQYNEIIKPIQFVLYDIDEFYYKEVKKLQDENMNQWNSN